MRGIRTSEVKDTGRRKMLIKNPGFGVASLGAKQNSSLSFIAPEHGLQETTHPPMKITTLRR